MAVIGKIRKRSGLIIALIGLSLLAFVLSDALNRNPFINNPDTTVGEIDGKKIEFAEYDQKLRAIEDNYSRQYGDLAPELKDMLRDQVWETYFRDIVLQKEYKKMNIGVTPEELTYIEFQSPVPHQRMVNYFTDPQSGQIFPQFLNPATGQLDLSKALNYRQTNIEPGSEQEKQWVEYIDQGIMDETINKKYFNYVRKGSYVTTLEAKEEYTAANNTLQGKLVQLNFFTIPDSSIKVTDAELSEYLQKHPEEFKQEASRKIEYVVFDIDPSPEDSSAALQWAVEKTEAFKNTTNDSLFIVNNGGLFDTAFINRGSLPDEAEEQLFGAEKGTVIGPSFNDGEYTVYKVLDTKTDTVQYVRASQILLRPNGTNREDTIATQKKAAELIVELKNGKDFKEAVIQNSLDPNTNSKGGDLGWFNAKTTALPKNLVNAVVRGKEGDYTIATTPQGVHVVKITHSPTSKLIRVGQVSRLVEPGKETYATIGSKANEFAGSISSEKQFNEAIDKMNLNKRFAENLRDRDREVSGIKDARKLVMWAYHEDRKVGDISEPFEAASNTKLIVARLVAIREKGTAKVDDVREQLEELVRKDKKAAQLKQKIEEGMKGATTIQEVAANLKVTVLEVPSLAFNAGNIASVGPEPALQGYMFGCEVKKLVAPIKGNLGVYVAWVESREETKAPDNLAEVKERLLAQATSSVDMQANEALRKKADIEDYRYKYY